MIGSLFSGTGGLDMAVQSVLGDELAWFVEYDVAPSKILEYHWPNVPNYGDVTAIDWALMPPVRVITAGYPCQPFSTAGKRKGANDERHLWPYVLDAVRVLRPELVVLENVRGHLTLGFDRVLQDLAQAGYDADWICLPASDAGAPHRRERLFIVAHPTNVGHERSGEARDGRIGSPNDSDLAAHSGRQRGKRRRGTGDLAGATRAGEGEGNQRERDGYAVDDRGPTTADSSSPRRERREDSRAGRGDASQNRRRSVEPERVGGERTDWGHFSAAIERWESVIWTRRSRPRCSRTLSP